MIWPDTILVLGISVKIVSKSEEPLRIAAEADEDEIIEGLFVRSLHEVWYLESLVGDVKDLTIHHELQHAIDHLVYTEPVLNPPEIEVQLRAVAAMGITGQIVRANGTTD